MASLDTRYSSPGNQRNKEGQQKRGDSPGIRDQTIAIEMVLRKIMAATVIKIEQKGTGEVEVKSSASDDRGGDI